MESRMVFFLAQMNIALNFQGSKPSDKLQHLLLPPKFKIDTHNDAIFWKESQVFPKPIYFLGIYSSNFGGLVKWKGLEHLGFVYSVNPFLRIRSPGIHHHETPALGLICLLFPATQQANLSIVICPKIYILYIYILIYIYIYISLVRWQIVLGWIFHILTANARNNG